MKISSTRSSEPSPRATRRLGHKRLWLVLGALALAGWSAAAFAAGVGYFKVIVPELQDFTGALTPGRALRSIARSPANWVRAMTSDAETAHLDIDLKFKDLRKLQEKRAEAFRMDALIAEPDDFVSAVMRHNGRSVKVKLRLKGDQTDHLDTDKWSFRVHVKSDDHVFGMRRFSLQAPKTRHFQLEAMFHAYLRSQGILAPRYFFVDVSVNGKDIGLMAVEEHFSKELLESQGRREGVMLKFDESRFWDSVAQTGQAGPYNNFNVAMIQPFQLSLVQSSPRLSKELDYAVGLLRAFVRGELPADAVFDVDLMARFMAAAEVWRAPHALQWINVRFYYNPLIARLEPIGYDAKPSTYTCCAFGLVSLESNFGGRLLQDPAIRAAFARELPRMARDMVDGAIEGQLADFEEHLMNALHHEFPMLSRFDYDYLRAHSEPLIGMDDENFDHFNPMMGRADLDLPTPVLAYIQEGDDGPYLELTNALPIEVSVTELSLGNGNGGGGSHPLRLRRASLPVSIPPTAYQGAPVYVRIPYQPDAGGMPEEIQGVARVRGQDRAYPFVASRYSAPVHGNPLPSATLEEVLDRHDFLSWNPAAGWLEADAGVHAVDGFLVLPPDVGLHLGPGTTLRFEAGRGIIARGPLRFEGREGAPVVLEGRGKTPWAGVFVLESESPSEWAHVEIRDPGGFDLPGFTLTGSVTFRKNEVSIRDSHLTGNRAEDALNIVRSKFSLRNVAISRTSSDAFDGDFVQGMIEGGEIHHIGGDGIDVSGSEVEVSGVLLADIRDKAVSIGEKSRLEARGLRIERVGTGVVSKDGSHGIVSDSTFTDVAHAAVMAYTKKPEYGPASLVAEGLVVDGVGRVAVAQSGSRVVVDGSEIDTEAIDIDALYSDGYMRK